MRYNKQQKQYARFNPLIGKLYLFKILEKDFLSTLSLFYKDKE